MRWPGSWDWEWEGTAERDELGREWGDDECAVCAGCLATRGRVVVKKKLKMEAGSSEKRQEHRYYSSR